MIEKSFTIFTCESCISNQLPSFRGDNIYILSIMKIFIHVNDNLSYKVADLPPNKKVGSLVKEYVPEMVFNRDHLEDVEVYIRNKKDDLDKGKFLDETGIKDGDHLFVGRCKSVDVVINYAGKELTMSVPPSMSSKRIRRKSLEFFGISEDDGVDLLLWFDQNKFLDDRNLIGSTTDYGKCAVKLSLASKQDIQGAPAEEVFQGHLNNAEYLSGVMDQSWGNVSNSKGLQWPLAIFWVMAKNGIKYFFRFDLQGYNEHAPTAILWDIEKSLPLEQSKWPSWNKRTKQVFRKWGKECLYLPCDRLALQGHNNWNQQHAYLTWKAYQDSFTKYLVELYQILNY